MTWIFFAAYTALSGLQQGIIVWLLTEYVPPSRKDWIDAAFHTGGLLIYALLITWAVLTDWNNIAQLLLAAVLCRALLFDLSLNAARAYFNRREGRPSSPLFQVGYTSLSDRTLRRLAPENPERLRLILWLLTLAGSIALGLYLYLRKP